MQDQVAVIITLLFCPTTLVSHRLVTKERWKNLDGLKKKSWGQQIIEKIPLKKNTGDFFHTRWETCLDNVEQDNVAKTFCRYKGRQHKALKEKYIRSHMGTASGSENLDMRGEQDSTRRVLGQNLTNTLPVPTHAHALPGTPCSRPSSHPNDLHFMACAAMLEFLACI